MIYPLNSVPRSTATFTDANDDPADPTAVTVTVTSFGGSPTVYTYGVDIELVKASTGVYYIDILVDVAGFWTVDWLGTGDVAAAFTEYLQVGGPTAADWVSETEQHLNSGTRTQINVLDGLLASGLATVDLADPMGSITAGSLLSVDLEEMLVRSTSGQSATVLRAVNGTLAAAHPDGSVVYVNPNHTKFRILRALNQELQSLASAGLFQPTTVDLTYSPNRGGYDLPGVNDLSDIDSVYANYTGRVDDWSPIYGGGYEIARNQDLGDFPSSLSLRLFNGGEPGRQVRVVYKRRFSPLPSLAADVTTTGLPESAYDIPPLGAAARLTAPREIGRNDTSTQGDTRRAEEVPAGAVGRSASFLWQLRNTRLGEELRDLKRKYPNRTRV